MRAVSEQEMVTLMGGHPPPEDFDQASAYFQIAFELMSERQGREWADIAYFYGFLPEVMVANWDASLKRHARNSSRKAPAHEA
jgi:hypothetical protein